jgi:hypothetical protein
MCERFRGERFKLITDFLGFNVVMQIEYELEFCSLYRGEQKQVLTCFITGFIYMELSFSVSQLDFPSFTAEF